MNRNEVKTKLASVNHKIDTIEKLNEDVIVTYVTKDKYLPEVGYIPELDTIADIVAAQTIINELSNSDYSEAIKMLGLTENEIPKTDTKILGFFPKHWNSDIITRLGELRNISLLQRLYDAQHKLTKHLSDDDKFEIDTEGIDDLL